MIIGGGDTGADCLGTAHRQGAASVTQLEILPRPPAARPDRQPWPTYPPIATETTDFIDCFDARPELLRLSGAERTTNLRLRTSLRSPNLPIECRFLCRGRKSLISASLQ